MTGEEIIKRVQAYFIQQEEETEEKDEEFYLVDFFGEEEVFPLNVAGKNQVVYAETGYEGSGEHCEIVYHFQDFDVYLKWTGRYQSYDGTEWDDTIRIVRPEEKIIIVYN